MKYPVVSKARMIQVATDLLDGGTPDVMAEVTWSGSGEEIDRDAISELAIELDQQLEDYIVGPDAKDRDKFEGLAAGRLHAGLASLPVAVLDDPGFWRFLALRDFWRLIVWRESSTFEHGDWGKYRKYVDGTNPSECVLMRMFIRGQLTEDDGAYPLAGAISNGTDFWRSHVIRVRTGTAPAVTKAFAAAQAEDRMTTDVLRPYAKRLNRVWTNVVLHTYNEAEATALVDELRHP